MSTIETAFRGRVPLVNLDKGSAIPLRFVFELPHKLAPSDIRDGLRERVVFDHVLDVQTLDAYDLVLTYDLCREFVLIITPSIGYSGMDTSHLALSLPTVLTSLFLLGMSSLSLCQVLFILGKELGIAVRMSIARDDHALESQIKPHLLIDNRQMLDIFLYQDGDEVAVSTIFGDGYGRGSAPLGQRTRPMNIKRSVHSGESQVFPIPLEGGSYVSSRLLSMLLMRRGILSTSLKEVTKGAIQMTKGLLQGDTRHLIQPGMIFLLLESRQAFRCPCIVETFTVFEESIGALSQCPIVDIATTAESTGKNVCLLISWREPVLVCSLLLHTLPDSTYCVESQVSCACGRAAFHPHSSRKGSSGRFLIDFTG